ncbi:MAG: hypothetical protein H7061_02580 [Bdellovibrionaceae bacterium]|nr:hypothetical protein [Bdellovibrio sp.]
MKLIAVILFSYLLLLFTNSKSYAEDMTVSVSSKRLSLLQQIYTGAEYKSFSKSAPAFGIQFSIDRGHDIIRYYLKGRFTYSESQQSFLNSVSPFTSRFNFASAGAELGFNLYPFLQRPKGFSTYVNFAGVGSYNQLEMETVPSGSKFSKNEQAFSYGYGGGLGLEWLIDPAQTKTRWLLFGEIGYRYEVTALAQQNAFEISGLMASFGFGF